MTTPAEDARREAEILIASATDDARGVTHPWRRDIDALMRIIARERAKIIGYQRECAEVEQVLGKALGYPWYKDDPKNFPNAAEESGVCVGEHTPASIAAEASERITAERANSEGLRKALGRAKATFDVLSGMPFPGIADVAKIASGKADAALSASPSPNDLPGNWRTPEQVREQLLGDEDLLR